MGEAETAHGQPDSKTAALPVEAGELASCRLHSAYFRKIISRYLQEITAGEQKNVPELKYLVNPQDPVVLEVMDRILFGLQANQNDYPKKDYEYPRDFAAFAKEALAFVQTLASIKSDLGVPFWLAPKDIVELGAADSFDRAVFLCAVLNCAGCIDAKVLVLEVEGEGVHPVVKYQDGPNVQVCDPSEAGLCCQYQSGTNPAQGLADFYCGGKRVLKAMYEFNSQEYSEFD
jgi:hypothetical protein